MIGMDSGEHIPFTLVLEIGGIGESMKDARDCANEVQGRIEDLLVGMSLDVKLLNVQMAYGQTDEDDG